MPFLRLFDFEPTVMTERTFASLSNLHIKKKLGRRKVVVTGKNNNNNKKNFKSFSVFGLCKNQYSLVSIK